MNFADYFSVDVVVVNGVTVYAKGKEPCEAEDDPPPPGANQRRRFDPSSKKIFKNF